MILGLLLWQISSDLQWRISDVKCCSWLCIFVRYRFDSYCWHPEQSVRWTGVPVVPHYQYFCLHHQFQRTPLLQPGDISWGIRSRFFRCSWKVLGERDMELFSWIVFAEQHSRKPPLRNHTRRAESTFKASGAHTDDSNVRPYFYLLGHGIGLRNRLNQSSCCRRHLSPCNTINFNCRT